MFDRLWVLFRLEGIDEEGLNEHAVDDPEEVVRMVEMWVIFLIHFLLLTLVSASRICLNGLFCI